MEHTKQPSPRKQACEKIAQFIRDNHVCSPFGGDVSLAKGQRPYYITLFSLPRNLDGSVSVYSPGFILVQFRSRYHHVPHEGRLVFSSPDDAISFLDAAFVKMDDEATGKAMEKAK